MKTGQKPYGTKNEEKFILERILFLRDERKPRLSFKAIADELNKTTRTKRGNLWSAVMTFRRYKKMKELNK